MNFADTPEESAFRAEARAFLAAHAPQHPPVTPSTSEREVVARARAWQACKADHGWACITWPRRFGGREASPIQSAIFSQEEARFRLPPYLFTVGMRFVAPAIMAHGTDAQQERTLRHIARGDDIWCQLFSEPAAGSDLAGLRTTAVREGDAWVIRGQKNWTTGGAIADYGVIVTRTDPHAAKHAGLTCFILDMRTPGIEVRPIQQMDGGQDFSEVFLTDVRVPDGSRLGEVNDGWRVAVTILMHERQAIGGGGGRPIEDLLELAGRCGQASAADVRQRIAEFYVQSTGLRYTGYRTLTALSRGQTPGPEASLGKLVGAPLRQRIASFALELQGAAGAALDEDGWQSAYLGAPGMRIAGGTDEILRNILAERVLGLPPEPRLDKGVPFHQVPSGAR